MRIVQKLVTFFYTLLLPVTLVGILVLAGYNIYKNPNFFDVNAGILLTSLIAILFAYLLNQRKEDERNIIEKEDYICQKKKDQIEKIIVALKKLLSEDFIVSIDNENDRTYNKMFVRTFDNKLRIVKKIGDNIVENDALKNTERHFIEYRDFVGENDSVIKLQDSENTLQRLKSNLDDGLDELITSMYVSNEEQKSTQ